MEILRYELAQTWRGTLGFMVAVALAATLYLSLYGSIADMVSGPGSMVSQLPEAFTKTVGFDAITSGAGFAQSSLYGLLGFILITIAAIVWGTTAVAGAEESGHLEITLAHNVSRTSYFFQTFVGLLLRTGAMAVTAGVMTWLLNEPGKLDIEPAHIIPMCISYWLLGLSAGCAALGVGAVSGQKRFATGAGAGVAVVGYVLNALGRQNADWEWMLHASPYHWAFGESPLSNGWDGMGILWLVLLSTAFVVLGWAVFIRRDIA